MHQAQFTVDNLPEGKKIAIVVSHFHRDMTDRMVMACKDELNSHGMKDVPIYEAPGAFEIPLLTQKLIEMKKYDCVIVLGVIVRGDTYHFELVADQCARGIMDVMLRTGIPIIFEVLATYDTQQAVDRSTGEHNKGREAALSALKILSTIHNLS
jgi:6,7-dimethyl-8-ribityllumazine synthase